MLDENRLANLVQKIIASNEIRSIAMRCYALRRISVEDMLLRSFWNKFAIDTKTGGRADGNGELVAGMGGVRTGE